jgi:hypothetical protein
VLNYNLTFIANNLFSFLFWEIKGAYFLKQKEKVGTIMLRLFLVGMSLNFNANYHDLEEQEGIAGN